MNSITVIGSGNAFNTDGRSHSAFLIDIANKKFLVDFGATALLSVQKNQIDISGIEEIFFTHFHADHLGGLPFLLLHFEYIEKRTEPLIINGPEKIKKAIKKLLKSTYPGFKPGFKLKYRNLKKNKHYSKNNLIYSTVNINHRKESLGYRFYIKSNFKKEIIIAFSGDTVYDKQIKKLGKKADILFLECSTPENLGFSHVSFEEILENPDYIKYSKKIVFTHLYDETADFIDKNKYKLKNLNVEMITSKDAEVIEL